MTHALEFPGGAPEAGLDDGALSRSDAELFSLLAAAVAGRRLLITGGGGEYAWSDGERILVADIDDHADVRDGLVIQAALVASGSLDARTVARLAGRRRLRRRYLTLEALRAADELASVMPSRVADRVAAAYDAPAPRSREESLSRTLSNDEAVPEAPAWMGTIKPGKVILASPSVAATAPTEKDKQGLSKEVDVPELDDEEESEPSKIMKLFQAPAMNNRLAEYFQKLMGMGRTPQAEGAGGAEMPVASHRAGKVGANAERADDAVVRSVGLELPPSGRLYPEWDYLSGQYRRDWCAVAEYDPRPAEDGARVAGDTDQRLRRELARLGLAYERHRRQDEGDVLDITALVDLVADRNMGVDDGDHRVYEARRKTAHDLGVLVLLDTTGSTGESDDGARIFDEQRELAARLTATLDELGDRVATYGFQSWGRQSIQFLHVKGFDDRYDHAAQGRIAALQPAGFTRLGAAIRHGTFLLSERSGTTNNLLVVIGDGLPYDDGYEHRYAQEDCRKALEEAVLAGVGCVCLSMRSATNADILDRVWGHVPYAALERPSELARQVGPLFRSALKEAAASRRRT